MKNHNENKPGYKKTKIGWIPEDWECLPFLNVFNRITKPVDVKPDSIYQEIGIRSHGKGIFHKEPIKGIDLGNKRVFWVHPNALVFNIVFAWEQAVAVTSKNENGYIASHRFPMYLPKKNKCDENYILNYFKTKRGKLGLELASPGGAGRNKTLGQDELRFLYIPIPPLPEQKKIAAILSTWDRLIEKTGKLIELKQKQKKGLMQKLLTGKVRFKEFVKKGNHERHEKGEKKLPDGWKEKRIIDVLKYERPDNYITSKYDKNSKEIPVLTANKSFILGYTNGQSKVYKNHPVVIFDDFTTDSKYVDFDFSVKSSAIKILKTKNHSDNLKFIYELMQLFRFPVGDHKRYYISEYQHVKIKLPSLDEQTRIASVLSTADREIDLLKKKLNALREQKKGLMQKLLTGEVRVKV